MAKRKSICIECGQTLTKDEVGLSKKIISVDGTTLYCFPCMAEYVGCMVNDLLEKVEEFKEEGCTLFQ